MADPLNVLEQALAAQNGSDPIAQRRANQFLENFQNTKEAWGVVDRGLRTDSKRLVFFCAVTLHYKIKFHFSELSSICAAEKFRAAMIEHVKRHQRAMRAVREKLCAAVAQLALQDSAWTNVIDFLAPRFDTNSMESLLRILKFLPEECRSRRCTASRQARRTLEDELTAKASDVLGVLLQCMNRSQQNNDLVRAVFQCLQSWFRYIRMPPAAVAKSPLLMSPFQAIRCPQLVESAVDTILEIVRSFSNPARHMDVIKKVLPAVMELKRLFHSKDEDTVRGLVRIFTETGEAYLDIILGSDDVGLLVDIVKVVLECTKHPNEEIAKITYHFWYVLAEGLECIKDDKLRCRRLAQFAEAYHPLAIACLHRMCLPTDFLDMDKEEKGETQHFREEIGDILRDCCLVLGGQKCGAILWAHLQSTCKAYLSLSAEEKRVKWRPLEAVIFSYSCVRRELLHRSVPVGDAANFIGGNCGILVAALQVHRVLRETSSTKRTESSAVVRNTCLDAVGRYAPWIRRSPEKFLQFALQESVQALGDASTCALAARVFCDICVDCGEHVSRNIQILKNILAVHQQAVEKPLPKKELMLVTKGLARTVRLMKPETAILALDQLLKPCKHRLGCAARDSSVENMILLLDALTEVFSNLDGVANVVRQKVRDEFGIMWNSLRELGKRYSRVVKVVEKLCRLYKHTIRCLGSDLFKEFAEDFCRHTVALFQVSFQSPFLYASGIAVESLAKMQDAQAMLGWVLVEITKLVLGKLKASSEAVRENPDVVEDYFDCVARYVRNCPQLLLSNALLSCLSEVLYFAATTLSVEHREANRSVIFFIESLLSLGVEKKRDGSNQRTRTAFAQPLLGILAHKEAALGRHLVGHIFRGIAGGLPLDRVDDPDGSLTDVLFKLNALCGVEHFKALIVTEIQRLPSTLARDHDKEAFQCALFGERGVVNSTWAAHWHREAVTFSSACRSRQRGGRRG